MRCVAVVVWGNNDAEKKSQTPMACDEFSPEILLQNEKKNIIMIKAKTRSSAAGADEVIMMMMTVAVVPDGGDDITECGDVCE